MSTQIDFEAMEREHPELKAFYDNKRLFYINVFWLIVGGAAAALGVNTASTVMPLHMAKIGLDSEQISNIMAIRGYLMLPLALYLAQLSDRWQSKRGRRLPFLAASIPFTVAGMWLFPYTSTLWPCLLVFAVFHFAMNVKYDTYPFIAYDIARQEYWGRVNGLNLVLSGIGVWLGQVVLMPMMDARGEKHVYMLAALIVGVATVLTVLFSKEPPIRSETPPEFNPIPVIKHVIKVGFANKRHVQLFVANGLINVVSLVMVYIPLQAMVNLHMTKGDIGRDVLQYATIATTVLAFFVGWAIDKIGSPKAVLLGFVLAVAAMVLGFAPSSHATLALCGALLAPVSFVAHRTITPSPWAILAVANVLVSVGYLCIYWAQHVFTASCVRREDLATFGTCNGAVVVAFNTVALQFCGVLIKRVFGGNYGVAFVIGTALCAIGVPMFFSVVRRITIEREVQAAMDGALDAAVHS